MLFEHAASKTKQGDIGESRAIYEYTRMGYVVSRTLFNSAKYELVVDCGNSLNRVQVKTTTVKNESGGWAVFIATSGGNTREHTRQAFNKDACDFIFVLNADGECWSIPTAVIDSKDYIVVGNKKYNEYRIV